MRHPRDVITMQLPPPRAQRAAHEASAAMPSTLAYIARFMLAGIAVVMAAVMVAAAPRAMLIAGAYLALLGAIVAGLITIVDRLFAPRQLIPDQGTASHDDVPDSPQFGMTC